MQHIIAQYICTKNMQDSVYMVCTMGVGCHVFSYIWFLSSHPELYADLWRFKYVWAGCDLLAAICPQMFWTISG